MECHNNKDCNLRLQKVMQKVKKELCKVDKLLKECDKHNVCYNPNKQDKRKIINALKANSEACCIFIEEMEKYRNDVKFIVKCFEKTVLKYEHLKSIRTRQVDQMENINCYIKNELLPKSTSQDNKTLKIENQNIRNEENQVLEREFEKITTQFTSLVEKYEQEKEHLNDCLKCIIEENNRDKMMFCLAIRYIQKAFNIRAGVECKQLNFIECAFPESEDNNDDDESICCCNTEYED